MANIGSYRKFFANIRGKLSSIGWKTGKRWDGTRQERAESTKVWFTAPYSSKHRDWDCLWSGFLGSKHLLRGYLEQGLGCWFGTWLLFFHSVGDVIIPTDFYMFQRGRAQPPTRLYPENLENTENTWDLGSKSTHLDGQLLPGQSGVCFEWPSDSPPRLRHQWD